MFKVKLQTFAFGQGLLRSGPPARA
jgi:hypothetical protein